jgi:Tfp pilus assembly protein PilF
VRVLNNLASEYQALGRIDDAEREYNHALAIARQVLGTEHMVYGTVLRNYSAMLQKNGRKKEGKALEAESKVILAEDARRNGKGMAVDVSALRQ